MGSITTDEIRQVFSLIVQKLDFEGIKKVEFADDFYWHFSADEWHKRSSDECTPLLGSLYDDIDSLKLIVRDRERPCTFVDFDRLAHVLQEISQKLNPPD